MARTRFHWIRPTTGLLAVTMVTASVLASGADRPVAAATTSLACSMGAAGSGVAVPGGGRAVAIGPYAQIRPTHTQVGASAATVCAARNSSASFQLQISASSTALSGVTLTGSALTGPGGATLEGTSSASTPTRTPMVSFSVEDYVTLTTTSDNELSAPSASTPAASVVVRDPSTGRCTDVDCRFPDALRPDRDRVFGERRNAFPLQVPAGENRVVWTDIFVPQTAAPGMYTGTVRIADSIGSTSFPVRLQVTTATLPSTSSVHSVFFSTTPTAAQYAVEAEFALNARISLSPTAALVGSTDPLLPLLKGTDARVDLPGARITDFAMSLGSDKVGSDGWSPAQFAQYRTLLSGAGRAAIGWAYCDEITGTDCAKHYGLETTSTSSTTGWTGVPLLAINAPQGGDWPDPNGRAGGSPTVTPSSLASTVASAAKVATVNIVQYLDPIAGFVPDTYQKLGVGNRMPSLSTWRAASSGTRQVWAYSSNMSGYSGVQSNSLHSGTPSYGIDQVASEQAALGWQTFLYGLNGILYWKADGPLDANTIDASKSGLVGDGSLFTATGTFGGTHAVPLQSIRLMRIRQGQQDYELLRLATTAGQSAAARSIATTAFAIGPTGSRLASSAISPTRLDAAEQQLASLFAPTSTTPPAVRGSHDLDCSGTADLLAVTTDGHLVLYPRTAADDWGTTIDLGAGYGGVYRQLLMPGDVTGDGRSDVVGRRSDGSVWVLAGDCAGHLAAPALTSSVASRLSTVGDFDGDGRVDLLDVRSDGTLVLLPGHGDGSFGTATRVGAGWSSNLAVGVGDVDGDGAADVVCRPSTGPATLFRGDGHGGWKNPDEGQRLTPDLSQATLPVILGPGDANGDGRADVVGVDTHDQLVRFAGTGTGDFAATGQVIGHGWASLFSLIAS